MLETIVVRMLAFVGVFFPGVNPDIEMSRPVVELRNDRIAVSCVLTRPLSDDLANVIESGTEVRLTFICRLRREDGTPAAVPDTLIQRAIVKNLVDGVFEMRIGERLVRASQVTEYSQVFRLETVPLWSVDAVSDGGPHVIDISARLEPIYIHATGRNYDLMALWNFTLPENRSPVFTRADLEERRVTP